MHILRKPGYIDQCANKFLLTREREEIVHQSNTTLYYIDLKFFVKNMALKEYALVYFLSKASEREQISFQDYSLESQAN